MLKSNVLGAINAARDALEDLISDVTVVKRSPTSHVPGVAAGFTETSVSMKLVVVDYEEKEIDGQRILAFDKKAVLFPSDGPIAVNDKVIDSDGTVYRVLTNKSTLVGGEVAINTLHLRPT